MKLLKALIVEDVMDDVVLLLHHLANQNYEVKSTIVQTAAEMSIELTNSDFDIILSDYEMPGFNGLEALQILKNTELDIPFIIISGVIGEDAAVRAMQVGVHDYIMKSNLKRLAPAIEREIQQAAIRREQKKIEIALHKSEASLNNAQRIAHLGNWTWDIKNNTILGSDEAFRIFDFKSDQFDVTFESFLKKVHQKDKQLVQTAIDMAFVGDGSFNIEHRIICSNNEEKSVLEIGEVIFDEAGHPLQLNGTVQDITERRKAKEKLQESEAKFRDLFDNAPIAYHELDSEGRFARINHTEELLLGYTEAELIGRHPAEIIVEKESLQDTAAKLANKMPLLPIERTFIRKDDTLVSVLNEDRLIYDKKGTIIGIRSTLQNITARKRIEEALAAATQRERAMIDNSLDVICTIDAEGKFASVSPASLKVWGYQPEELISMPYINYVAAEDIAKTNKVSLEIMSGIETRNFENRYKHKNGSKVDIRWTAYWSETDQLMFCVAHDITETKELEAKLRQAQKLESVGLLAGGIAHDFNNMLTVINGFSDLTLRRMVQDDPLRRNIEEIKNAGNRSASLTYQLLAFSRQQILQPIVLNFNDIVTDTIKILNRLIGEDIQLTTSLNPKVGRVKIDPGQFSQIIMNLAINARDAMPIGGKLTIETANVFLEPYYTERHQGIIPGSYVMLAVSDNGSGMSRETKEHIFEPFFTTKSIGQGTGLGLATVYGIVKQSGGNIEVYSESGVGTTFKIYFPRVIEAVGETEIFENKSQMTTGTETILLVEDEELVRKLSKDILETCGYTVIEAGNGVEALAICDSSDIKFDLLVTDVVMPEMGGSELSAALRLNFPNLKVIYTSGYTDNAIMRHGIIEANTKFIQKPFTPDQFASKIRQVLDDKTIKAAK